MVSKPSDFEFEILSDTPASADQNPAAGNEDLRYELSAAFDSILDELKAQELKGTQGK